MQKIKTAAKERKTMLTEKKEISFWNASKHKELSAKIAKLTEDIEELKSEKAVLLNQLDYADDSGIAAIKKDIADAEASLSKLEQQEKSILPSWRQPLTSTLISKYGVQTLMQQNCMHRE